MKLTVFSLGCPKCIVLEKKLTNAGLDYTVVDDEKQVEQACNILGTTSIPVLRIDDENKYMGFSAAVQWLKEREEQE